MAEIERQNVDEHNRSRRGEQLKAYLDRVLIRQAKIRGVGGQRVATLASYGIETASDVTEKSVMRAPGFGPRTAATLVGWRMSVEAKFVYEERRNAADQIRHAAIKAEVARLEAELRRKLLGGPGELSGIRADVEARRTVVDPQLSALDLRRKQLAVDLES